MMKKIWIFLCTCLLGVLILVLRIPPEPYRFMHDISVPDQIQIDIVNLETEMGYHQGFAYNEEFVSVIRVIELDQKEAFLEDFLKIKSHQPVFGSRIDFVSGLAIRFRYPNDDIELITSWGTATVSEGTIRVHTITFNAEPFDALLDRYS